MSKISRFNAARQFEINSKQIEEIADYAIEYQIKKNRVPVLSVTCKMVMAELASKYDIMSRMKKDVLDSLAKFVGNEIMKKYIWKPSNIGIAQKLN